MSGQAPDSVSKKPFNWRWFLKAAGVVMILSLPAIYAWFCPLFNQDLYSALLFAHARGPNKYYVRLDGAGHGDEVMLKAPAYAKSLKEFVARLDAAP